MPDLLAQIDPCLPESLEFLFSCGCGLIAAWVIPQDEVTAECLRPYAEHTAMDQKFCLMRGNDRVGRGKVLPDKTTIDPLGAHSSCMNDRNSDATG